MKAKNEIRSISKELDCLYGKVGTPERDEFRKEAHSYYTEQIIEQTRQDTKITQSKFARAIYLGE